MKLKFIFVLLFACLISGTGIANYNSNDPWHEYDNLDCGKLDITIFKFEKFISKNLIAKKRDPEIIHAAIARLNDMKELRKRFCMDV